MQMEKITTQEWLRLTEIEDRTFQKALTHQEFARIDKNGKPEVNVHWLFPWAWSDENGNRRFSITAPAIRAAWPGYAKYDKDTFLPEARRLRYDFS